MSYLEKITRNESKKFYLQRKKMTICTFYCRHISTAKMKDVLFTVVLVQLLHHVTSFQPYMEPFFFLCNYHGNTQEVGGFDKGEIAVSVSVEGNPEYYTPEQFYNSKSFILTRNDLFVNGNLLIY